MTQSTIIKIAVAAKTTIWDGTVVENPANEQRSGVSSCIFYRRSLNLVPTENGRSSIGEYSSLWMGKDLVL